MRRLIVLFCSVIALQTQAQLVMTDETSTVKFTTRHLGTVLEGGFKGVEGRAGFNPSDLGSSYFKMSFATNTITTNDNYVSPNLIKPECFDPRNYPTIELFSTRLKKLPGANSYEFRGQLKVKGKTKQVAFPMTVTPNAGGYDFSFVFAFQKKPFGLKCAVGKDFKLAVKTYGKKIG